MENNPASTPSAFSRITGPGLAMGSMFSAQFGAALAVPLMVAQGSFGVSALRLACAAVLSLIFIRPNFRSFDLRQWRGAVALGLVMAAMTLCYFMAVTKIPVGPAITFDYLGPLSIAIMSLRGWPQVILPALATGGVLAMTYSNHGWLFAPAGILFALAGAVGWAGYIVLMRHVGQLFSDQDGLCLSFTIAAIVALPLTFIFEPSRHWLANLPAIAGLALLFPLIPFGLELVALRRMEMGTFSILMSLEPAIGALLGFCLLGQTLSLRQMSGVLAVMAASAGAVLMSPKQTAFVLLSETYTPKIGGGNA